MRNKYLLMLAGLSIVMILLFSCSKDMPTDSANVDELSKYQAAEPGHVNVLIGLEGTGAVNSIAAVTGKVMHEYKHFPIVFASIPQDAVSTLASSPGISFVEKNMIRHFSVQTLDWGVDRIDADYVHANSAYTGDGIDVAIIDSGGDDDHPDLTWAGGYNFYSEDTTDWNDETGHATHCAGIIGADDNNIGVIGVAPEADLWALRVGYSDPYLNLILEAADWCIDTHYDADPYNNIKVVSMSYGGGYSYAEEVAMDDCYNAGILLVAAAGNGYGSPVDYPGALSSVMAISASDSNDDIANYSDYGAEIELIAPGSNIYSTYAGNTYATLSGTSMACPMVAGTAALAWEAHSGYSNAQIRALLQNTAEDIGLPAIQQGSGLVDAKLDIVNGGDTMHINSISFGQQRWGWYYILYIYVNIHEDDHSTPVENAYVDMTLYHHGGSNYYFGGYTDGSGTIAFGISGASQGMSFTATVTDVTKNGWTYDDASNHETSDSYTIQ